MKLSLSVRIAESFSDKSRCTLSLDELIDLATSFGYSALCLRASLVGIQSPKELVEEVRRKVDAAGLVVSMVTGDFVVPQNNERGPEGLRNITPYLDLTEAVGSDLIRICMKEEEDIAYAQRAADEAAERGIRLAHQSHTSSLFETVDGSVRVLEAVGRSNFGIIYEPANWMLVGQDYGTETIRRLEPWLFNVYVQNHRLDPTADEMLPTWTAGEIRFQHLGMWEPGGVDSDVVFTALKDVGYAGFVTVHQAFAGILSPSEAAAKTADFLRPKLS